MPRGIEPEHLNSYEEGLVYLRDWVLGNADKVLMVLMNSSWHEIGAEPLVADLIAGLKELGVWGVSYKDNNLRSLNAQYKASMVKPTLFVHHIQHAESMEGQGERFRSHFVNQMFKGIIRVTDLIPGANKVVGLFTAGHPFPDDALPHDVLIENQHPET